MATRNTNPHSPILEFLLKGLNPAERLTMILYYANSMSLKEIDAALTLCTTPHPIRNKSAALLHSSTR